MRFKLDENFGRQAAAFLREAGHDVMTVRDERLGGAEDAAIFSACAAEERVLITLDHDFGSIVRFPPETSAGIVVIELPPGQSQASISAGLQTLLDALRTHPFKRALWIVEPGRVRIRQQDDSEDDGR